MHGKEPHRVDQLPELVTLERRAELQYIRMQAPAV
jgi:hypothetical protein